MEHWLPDETVTFYRESWLAMLSRTLDRSQDNVKFRGWVNMLFIVAGLVGGMELTVFCLTFDGPPFPQKCVLLARAAWLLSIGLALVIFSAAEFCQRTQLNG